jgi:hypothetical protein
MCNNIKYRYTTVEQEEYSINKTIRNVANNINDNNAKILVIKANTKSKVIVVFE